MKKKNPLDWKCYNFALGLVEGKLVKAGLWSPEKAVKLSSELSKRMEKTVEAFFKKHPISKETE